MNSAQQTTNDRIEQIIEEGRQIERQIIAAGNYAATMGTNDLGEQAAAARRRHIATKTKQLENELRVAFFAANPAHPYATR